MKGMSLCEPTDSNPMISDALLVEGLRQGDEASFEALFHRHYPRVYRLLVRLVGDPAEAEELAQETFIRLYRRPLRRGDNVAGWLYRVATNLGYNALRGSRRRDQREQTVMAERSLTAPSAAAEAEQRALQAEVRATLARLRPREGQLLLLRQMGLSYRELAEALDVSPNSIGTLLARAEKAFRRAYGRGRG
jgi:RNA polymerase sigma-70 factor (ECF subfamily)